MAGDEMRDGLLKNMIGKNVEVVRKTRMELPGELLAADNGGILVKTSTDAEVYVAMSDINEVSCAADWGDDNPMSAHDEPSPI